MQKEPEDDYWFEYGDQKRDYGEADRLGLIRGITFALIATVIVVSLLCAVAHHLGWL